jgi:hypothetical protein
MRDKAAKKQKKEEARGLRRQLEKEEVLESRQELEQAAAPGASSSSSASGHQPPLQLVPTESGQMEVDDGSRKDSENQEFWGPLLKKLKASKVEGEMEVSAVEGFIREAEAECLRVGPLEDEDAICEVRAELIEEIVRARFRSREPGACLETPLEGLKKGPFCQHQGGGSY